MFGEFTGRLQNLFASKSVAEQQAVVAETIVQANDKIESSQDIVGAEEFKLDMNITRNIWNAWEKTKTLTCNRSNEIVQTFGSSLGIIAFCVKPGDNNQVVKKGKIAVIIENDGTQSTEEVVWKEAEKETHHKGSHSSSHSSLDSAKDSKITQPATKKKGSTG